MPAFTLELWRVLEFYPEPDPPTYANIGLDSYPIFDPGYRAALNNKIVQHYWNREIGQETVDMFKFAMRRRMNEEMPYFNKLYESERLTFDPFKTIDMQTVVSGGVNESANATVNNTGSSTGSSSGISGSRAVQSNPPQMLLSGDKDYATAAADTTGQSSTTNTGSETSESTTSTETTSETSNNSSVSGYQAMPSSLLADYRSVLLNIDMMVIERLADCFMLVWNSGDEYTRLKGQYYR